jgi:two-component system sensor histidine kinase EvgS
MNDILESLIDFSRLQTGTLTPRTEEVSLSEVVKSVVQAFEVTARLKGISLSLETCPEMLEIRIDRVHVRRMLSNLVSNALKYTEHGEVTVRLLQKDLRASVSVTDTGRGMTREQQDQLFTPFARFHTEMAEGIGLGLALTRSLAELNQVDLVVDSEPAKGSTFTLVFKKPVTCVDADRAHGLSVGSQTPGRRIRILVVDDNRDSVETLSRSLELRGLEVVRAYSVTEALSTLGSVSKEISLDVIVSDVHMPKGGVEAILAHRALMDNPPAVIVLSGSVTSSQRLLKAGVRRVLLKPADLNELVIEIERAVTEAAKPLERAA